MNKPRSESWSSQDHSWWYPKDPKFMNKPKYKIGEEIPDSPFIVRGVMTPSDGEHRYFLQLTKSNNTLVCTEQEIEQAIAIVYAKIWQHYQKST